MVSPADVNRLFLQAVLSRGILSTELAQSLWAKSIKAVNAADNSLKIKHIDTEEAWHDFVAKVNNSLDKLDLEFKNIRDELTGKEMYALVNRKGDEIAQMATDYTPTEISFFRGIVEQIVLAPHESFCVSSLAALREITALKLSMTKAQAEVVLASFVAKCWLFKSKNGRYSLHTRSLIELHPYLRSTYPDDILQCTICHEIVTRGVACHATANCKVRMHFHCFSTYRRRQSGCPACKQDWPRESKERPLKPVGEEAARSGDDTRRRVPAQEYSEDEDEPEPSQANDDTPPPTKRGSRRKSNKAVSFNASMDIDEEEEEEEEEEVPPTQIQETRRSRRSSGR